ncbi:MAG: T9SS type A sorting domain-containing protein [Flavobacteriales bacterium]|nr:T9SS type A sorting domain-containing protein [Flavobacteriales bacterium]|tara:strand:- start:50 stop:1834 length:1785 start_codon:yes stop_codon:yes gene_type:complete
MKYKFLVFFNCIAFFLSSQEVCTDLVVDPIYSLNNPNLFTKGFPNDLLFFDDFSTENIFVSDNLWDFSSAKVTRNYAINPPSLGVATFDGLDEFGLARDFSVINSSAPSDTLLSKPIDLSGMSTAFFMFYFQGKGLGETPEIQDKLVLEFFNGSFWVEKWSSLGIAMQEFEKEVIIIDSAQYLTGDFKFRFRNYATISGNFDHWHIDYLVINELLNVSDTTELNDVSFVYSSPSFLKRYYEMPWTHFLNNEANELKDSIDIILRNNSASVNVDFQFNVYENNSQIYHYPTIGVSRNVTILDYDTIGNFSFTNPPIDIQSNIFNSFEPDSASFLVQYIIKTSNSDIKINDTLYHNQNFFSHFAYDDKSAESAYGINTNGAMLAYEFQLNRPDTLRAIQMYFPQMLDSVSNIPFKLTIWKDINGQGDVLYQQDVFPVHTENGNYHTYYLDSLFQLVGTFYVGWEQTTDDLLNIGLDKNNNANEYMYYNVGSGWLNSSYLGSWMIRPILSMNQIVSNIPNLNNIFSVYPNPAKDNFFIESSANSNLISLYTLNGILIRKFKSNLNLTQIDVDDLERGVYILEISNDSGVNYQKILIQ